jgi:hypothetical protein
MSLEQLELAILALPTEQRRQLVVWLEEHRDHIIGEEDAEDELTVDQKAEILRRRDLALAHPDVLEPWDGTMERARQLLNEFRRQKAADR